MKNSSGANNPASAIEPRASPDFCLNLGLNLLSRLYLHCINIKSRLCCELCVIIPTLITTPEQQIYLQMLHLM